MSLGAVSTDDTLDDAMDEDTFDTIEDYDELDDLFAPPDPRGGPRPGDGLHKELVISAIAEIPVTQYLKSGLFALQNPSVPQVCCNNTRSLSTGLVSLGEWFRG